MIHFNRKLAIAGILLSAALAACAWAWFGLAAPASAAGMQASIPSVLHIDPVAPVAAGHPFTVTGIFYRQVEGGNAGIPYRGVKLYLETLAVPDNPPPQVTLLATVFSDADGKLRWVARAPQTSGRYRLYFLYPGSPTLRDSMATTELEVLSAPEKSKPSTLPASKQPNPAPVAKMQPALIVAAPQQPITRGEAFTVTARLLDAGGKPIPAVNLYLHVAGAVQQRVTDASGSAVFVIRKVLDPGRQLVDVIFAGRGNALPVQKQSDIAVNPPAATQLTVALSNTAPVYVGDELAFVAQLTGDGRPLPNAFIRVFLDGDFLRGATTDSLGQVNMQLPRSLPAGSHTISITLRDANDMAGAEAALPLAVLPRALELRTVPALQGVRIRVGGAVIETDALGVARTLLDKNIPVTATVLAYQPADASLRAVFDRWSDGVLSATRKLRPVASVTTTYQLGFIISHPVILHFVEQTSEREVDAGRLADILLVTSAGEAISLSATRNGLQWLKSNRIIRLEQMLVVSPVSYQLRKVTVDGVNVVNEGQQRFKVLPNAHWTMKLQMHDLEVEVRDALLGLPLGQGLRVDYPDGDSRHVALDETGSMRLESLSRGSYTVTVVGAQGIRSPMPIALSRNREVNIAVITYLDVAIAVGGMLFVAAAAMIAGRRKSLPRMLRSMR